VAGRRSKVRGGATAIVKQGDVFQESHRHISKSFTSNPKTSISMEQPLTLVRNVEVQKRTVSNPMHTEQSFNLRRETTQKRVASLNVCSEQHITLNRKTESSTRIALFAELPITLQRRTTQRRVSLLSVNAEQSLTLVAAGNRRLREQLEALNARVAELEKTLP